MMTTLTSFSPAMPLKVQPKFGTCAEGSISEKAAIKMKLLNVGDFTTSDSLSVESPYNNPAAEVVNKIPGLNIFVKDFGRTATSLSLKKRDALVHFENGVAPTKQIRLAGQILKGDEIGLERIETTSDLEKGRVAVWLTSGPDLELAKSAAEAKKENPSRTSEEQSRWAAFA